MRIRPMLVCLIALSAGGAACRPNARPATNAAAPVDDPCRLALASVGAGGPLAAEIAALQHRAADRRQDEAALEQLGYLFVARARLSHDDAMYAAAIETAACLEGRHPANGQARLLRGHVRHQQHRFADAETLARGLVATRGLAVDFALLGDALMEQGRLGEAATAYQRMIDLKPYYQSYTRAAHLRWLRGDLPGAIDLMRKAVASASPRDPEAGPWARTRLSDYYLQARQFGLARGEADTALAARPGYAPALVALARIHLAENRPVEAVALLRAAEAANPLPDVRWALADALRAANLEAEAGPVERALVAEGAAGDPRTLALYLATRGDGAERAIELATRELDRRGDVFTHDALAWALVRAGRAADAAPHMAKALAEGTPDGRLFLHGGVVAAASGDRRRARRLLGRAGALAHTLLPSERAVLAEARRALDHFAGESPRRSPERTEP